MTRTCDELGVCNGRHCANVSACADYDLITCNSCDCGLSDRVPCPYECATPCADAPAPTRPLAGITHPFAPGVIQRAPDDCYANEYGFPLDLRDWLYVLRVLLVFGGGMGLLVAWLTGRLS